LPALTLTEPEPQPAASNVRLKLTKMIIALSRVEVRRRAAGWPPPVKRCFICCLLCVRAIGEQNR
jgi:hypothetical protein